MADQYRLDEDAIGSVSGKPKQSSAKSDFDALSAELNAVRTQKEAAHTLQNDYSWDNPSASRTRRTRHSHQTTPTTRVRKAKNKHNWAAIIISLILVVLIAAGGIGYYFWMQMNSDPYGGMILGNVTVAGINVGGLDKEGAVQLLNSSVAGSYAEKNMVVMLDGQEIVLTPALTKARLNTASAVDAAYVISRTVADGDTSIKSVPLATHLGLDTGAIRTALKENCVELVGEYTPSSYHLKGTAPALDPENFDESKPCQTIELVLGVPGGKIDIDTVYSMVMDAYNKNQFVVTISGEDIMQLPEVLDLDAIYQEYCVEAEPVTKESLGSVGYTFPLEEVRTQLANAEYGDTLTIQMEYDIPKGFGANPDYPEVISTYSTSITGSNNYIKNIKAFCSLLNGKIIRPGETISLNMNYPRTKETGFVSAEIHPDQCSKKKTGGGEDQFATTLATSAIMADLKISQRHSPHHLCNFASDIPGSEVSIRTSKEDLKITNSLDYPVMIQAKASNTTLTISFLAKKARSYYILLESETLYPIKYKTSIIEKSASEGYTNLQVLQEGVDGASIHLYRVKYDIETNALIARTSEAFVEVPAITKEVVSVRN